LADFLEEEAERRMTTKSAVAQMIVADYARSVSVDSETENEPVSVPETHEREKLQMEDLSDGPIGEMTEIEFESKDEADRIRGMFGEWLDDSDDKRLTRVRFMEDTPVEVVEALQE
jgi:hypothetical protein